MRIRTSMLSRRHVLQLIPLKIKPGSRRLRVFDADIRRHKRVDIDGNLNVVAISYHVTKERDDPFILATDLLDIDAVGQALSLQVWPHPKTFARWRQYPTDFKKIRISCL